MLADAKTSTLLDMVKRTRPGQFLDARLSVTPENAIVYRTRQPLISEIIEVPMMQDFGVCRVSAIMCGRTQVGICVRFRDSIVARVTQGDHASFELSRLRGELGAPRTAMKTNDYLVFDFSSRGALLVKKLTKGRGYGN